MAEGFDGLNLLATTTVPQANLGEVRQEPFSAKYYRYVRAGVTVPIGSAVNGALGTATNVAVYGAVVLTPAAADVHMLGIASAYAFANLDYGWIQIGGLCQGIGEAAITTNGQPVKPSAATAGRLTLAAAADIVNACGYAVIATAATVVQVNLQGLV